MRTCIASTPDDLTQAAIPHREYTPLSWGRSEGFRDGFSPGVKEEELDKRVAEEETQYVIL